MGFATVTLTKRSLTSIGGSNSSNVLQRLAGVKKRDKEDLKKLEEIKAKTREVKPKNYASNPNLGKKSRKKDENLGNLYQNIGTRVSKLREINESYQKKIKSQKSQIGSLDDQIRAKEKKLEEIRKAKKEKNTDYFNRMIDNKEVKLNFSITNHHIANDPELNKLVMQKEKECSQLKNKLNDLYKKTEAIRGEINTLRVENKKLNQNYSELVKKKDDQTKEMNKISQEANRFLKEKEEINQNLIKVNGEIETEKQNYEQDIKELNQKIDNTKKIKEFHVTLFKEKYDKSSRRAGESGNETNRVQEEDRKLKELQGVLEKKKRETVKLNFSRLILLKKQHQLNNVIQKVKDQTGMENLDKLSLYLENSTDTNKHFEMEIEKLEGQKKEMQEKIAALKEEIQNNQCVLMDTSSQKMHYLRQLEEQKAVEELATEKLNKKLYFMNRVIDIIAAAFKSICLKLKFVDENINMEKNVGF